MSRIGNNPITIPEGVSVEVKDSIVTVKGKLGELTQVIEDITVKIEESIDVYSFFELSAWVWTLYYI